MIMIITRTASSYEQGPSPPARLGPHALQSPQKLAWDLEKKLNWRKWAWPIANHSAPFRECGGYKVFECETYSVGVIGKTALAEVIAPSAGGYM